MRRSGIWVVAIVGLAIGVVGLLGIPRLPPKAKLPLFQRTAAEVVEFQDKVNHTMPIVDVSGSGPRDLPVHFDGGDQAIVCDGECRIVLRGSDSNRILGTSRKVKGLDQINSSLRRGDYRVSVECAGAWRLLVYEG